MTVASMEQGEQSGSHYVEQTRAIMMEAATAPDAAVRFLNAIGYEEFSPACARHQLTLSMLTTMPMLDLERKLGVTPKKAVVALFDECGKLRRCLNRSSAAVELPSWLPAVLRVPAEVLESPPSGAMSPRRPQSARGARMVQAAHKHRRSQDAAAAHRQRGACAC